MTNKRIRKSPMYARRGGVSPLSQLLWLSKWNMGAMGVIACLFTFYAVVSKNGMIMAWQIGIVLVGLSLIFTMFGIDNKLPADHTKQQRLVQRIWRLLVAIGLMLFASAITAVVYIFSLF